MAKTCSLWIVVAVLAGGLALQHRALRNVQTELAALTAPVSAPAEAATASAIESQAAPESPEPASDNAQIDQRLTALEGAVRQLTLASEVLMERGHLPLSVAKLAELRRKFLDPALSDADRLEALRVLRREKAVDDEVVRGGVEWLQVLGDPASIRKLLAQFDGLESSFLREPLLRLATTHTDNGVRRQAIKNLESFVGDAAVDALLWKLLASEGDPDARRQVENSLRRGPMTEARMADLRQRALDSNASFRERLIAFQCMSSANVADAQMTTAFADGVVARGQTEETATLFRALDNTGNLAAAPALVKGLQSENTELRMLALDALSEMQSDATVVKWLKFVAENDTDARVRNEAVRVLAQGANQSP